MPKTKKEDQASRRATSSPVRPSSEGNNGGRKRYRRPKHDRSPSGRSRSRSRLSSKKIRGSDQENASKTPSVACAPKDDEASYSLTPNAIEDMIMGIDPYSKSRNGELILKLSVDSPRALPETQGAAMEGDKKITNCVSSNNGEENSPLFGSLSDGKYNIRVMILDPNGIWSKRRKRELAGMKDEDGGIDWIVKIHGYASTEKFWHVKYEIFPIICLTSISVLRTQPATRLVSTGYGVVRMLVALSEKPVYYMMATGKGYIVDTVLTSGKNTCKAQAGTIGTFLKERGPFLTNEELAGASRIRDPTTDPTKAYMSSNESNSDTDNALLSTSSFAVDQNFKKVHDCLSRHSAMITLQRSSSTSLSSPSTIATSTNTDQTSSSYEGTAATRADASNQPLPPGSSSETKRPTQHVWELYDQALREFRTTQMDRQKASLGTNAGRESAERAELVVKQHKSALELALKEEGPLTVQLLENWHKELLKGLHPEAGKIRTRAVRCGHTVFCPTKRVREELDLYCAGLKSLELRLDMANNALHVVLFAAIAMFGIIDIHPFVDGNGRLSRIVANYALKRLPFPINLFATPAQRNEYIVALERTRHVLSANCSFGDVSRDDLVQVIKYSGVFKSLVELIMDRVARAATALAVLWDEKSGLAAEAAEAQAARRVRERAARGTCMICLDEKPNIATLCCGNAIHLNCCAEWLSGNNRCPICRHEMPSISRRVVRAMEEPRGELGEDDNGELQPGDFGRRNPAAFSREYQNFVDRFWNEISHNNRGNAIRANRPQMARRTFLDDEDSVDSRESNLLHALESIRTAGRTGIGANHDEANPDETTTESPDSNDQDDEQNDTTTTFEEEDVENSDNLDTTTTTTDDSDGNADTTTYNSDSSSQQGARQSARSNICANPNCRNRPAVGCTNSLCGRCCVLHGNYHCVRHNT